MHILCSQIGKEVFISKWGLAEAATSKGPGIHVALLPLFSTRVQVLDLPIALVVDDLYCEIALRPAFARLDVPLYTRAGVFAAAHPAAPALGQTAPAPAP